MIADEIQLPEAPGIHGLRFRHFRGGRDFTEMATIIRASAEADDTERSDTPEELEHFFAHLTNYDPYTDMIFAEVDPGDGREPDVIGYSRGMWRMEGSGERRYIFLAGSCRSGVARGSARRCCAGWRNGCGRWPRVILWRSKSTS